MLRRISLILMLLVLVTSAFTACGAPPEAEAEPTAAPTTAAPATVAPATATPLPPTNTPAPPTNTPLPPTNTPAPALPTDTPAPAPAADTATPEKSSGSEAEEEKIETAPKWSPGQLFAQSDIRSYRSTMNLAVAGPAFENEGDLSFVILGEYMRDPEAQRIVMNMGEEVFMEMVQIGAQAWVNYAGMWMETSAEDTGDITEDFMLFDLEDIGDLDDFDKVGAETINGMKTTHYHFTEENLFNVLRDQEDLADLEGLDSAVGDVWVNNEGVVIKWVMHFEGTGINEESPDASGAMDITYELHDINASDIDIQPPESLSSEETLGFDLPVPEGATQTMSMAGMITYDVVDRTIAELSEFYQTEFATLGFTYDAETSMTSEDYSLLAFSDGSVTVSISIFTGEDGAVQIMVMTEAAE
jgi:hypothetical protein